MKSKGRKLFSATKQESGHLRDGHEKFKFVSCAVNGKYCSRNVLQEINEHYAQSIIFRRSKEFNKSIEALKIAYKSTLELPETPCSVCSAYFRSAIVESLENIHIELKCLSTGMFSTTRYESCHEMAEEVLKELKSTKSKELKSAV